MKTRVAICGFGGLGRVHADSLAGMADVEIVAVCDALADRLRAKAVNLNIDGGQKRFDIRSCRTYTDLNDLLKTEKPDAVVMALPTDMHAPLAIQAMNAGCHVFSEKPMALTLRECDRMIAARDRNRRQLMIGQCLRFWPEYESLRRIVQERTCGALISLTMERLSERMEWTAGGWMNQGKRSGGAILDLHLHDVDWALHALGVPASIRATGRSVFSGEIDDVSALWEYRDGFSVVLQSSWLYTGFRMAFRAICEKGIVEFGCPPDPALRFLRRGKKEWKKLPVSGPSGYTRELRYFLGCVRGRQTNTICSAESTRDSVALVMAEKQSIRTGRPVVPRGLTSVRRAARKG